MNVARLARALFGPVLIIIVLFATGFGAVEWKRSHSETLSFEAVSIRLWYNQTYDGWSIWNMTVRNNGTIPLLIGNVCGMNQLRHTCTAGTGPLLSGAYSYDPWPFFAVSGKTVAFELQGVNATYQKMEFHFQIWAWNRNTAPSSWEYAQLIKSGDPKIVWLFYDRVNGTFT